MSLRNVLGVLVPRRWNGAQALAVVRLLREVVEAIWAVHGEQMMLEMLDPSDPLAPMRLPPDVELRTPDEDDDIPF